MKKRKQMLPVPVLLLIASAVVSGLLAFQRRDIIIFFTFAIQFGLAIFYSIKWAKE